MAISKRTRTAILLQTFMIAGLVASMWLLGAGDSGVTRLPGPYPAVQLETQIFQSRNHNVLLFPAERWQLELVKRWEALGALADAFLAGRLTLIEAAEAFRQLDARSPNFDLENFQKHTPGRTDEEKYCRLVIMVVEGQLNPNDERAREVVSKLEKQLNQHISRGTLHFSTPSDETSPYPHAFTVHRLHSGERGVSTPR